MIETSQSFVVRQECEKAASENGFRRPMGTSDGWAAFASTTVPGTIHLAAAGTQGPWYLALDHDGVVEALHVPAADMPGPGRVRYAFKTLGQLYDVLPRVYQLSLSLPDHPLQEFRERIADLPRTTEVERLVVQRIGQDIFRGSLMQYWQGRCPLTGIADPELLRASHIMAWSACPSDADRLDIHNGLLLSALWDAAFDRGLVTFADDGTPRFSPALSEQGRDQLRWTIAIPLTDRHRRRLAWHRANLFV